MIKKVNANLTLLKKWQYFCTLILKLKTLLNMNDKNKKDKDIENVQEEKEQVQTDNQEKENTTDEKKESDEKDAKDDFDQKLAVEKDRYLRLFAEFENFKKRTAKERIELFKTANREVMTALLPVLDDFDRGLLEIKNQVSNTKTKKDDALLVGFDLIYNKLKSTLKQQGLNEMEVKAGDIFDAELHQAITQIPAPNKKMKNKIIDVTEKGYMLGDVIIRFPKVVVGK